MKQCIILTCGVPCCGKTTWANKFIERMDGKAVNVNRDDIRFMLTKAYNNFSKEDMVTLIQKEEAIKALQGGKIVVVSDTNMNEKTVNLWNNIAKGFGVPVFEKHFKDSLNWDLLVDRNNTRDKKVPEKVLREFYRRYREANFKPYKRNTSLPKAVVFDVDGTLAKMVGRSPYDWKRVGEDECYEDVADIARMFWNTDTFVIILTGRDGSCEQETRDWLEKHNIAYDALFIRPEGNFDKDSIVKYDIFKRELEPNYDVIGVFDDRSQVVSCWREIGVRCYQCADGNF